MTYFGGSPSRDEAKTGIIYINQYISRLTKEYMNTWPGGGQYIPRLRVTEEYIRRLGVTEEYTFISLGTDEYSGIYSSALYSSVTSSVNRGI
jgi:hypothetical protein